MVGTKRDLREYREVSEEEGIILANKLQAAAYREISSAEGYPEAQQLLQDSILAHMQSRFTDRDKQRRGLGLKKLKEGLLVRTKSLYRKRGMTF